MEKRLLNKEIKQTNKEMYYALFLYFLWKYGKYLEYGYNGMYYSYYAGKYMHDHIYKEIKEKEDEEEDWELV